MYGHQVTREATVALVSASLLAKEWPEFLSGSYVESFATN